MPRTKVVRMEVVVPPKRGAVAPEHTAANQVGFKQGHKKVGGRKKGTPNKLTADVKEAIVSACSMLGGSVKKVDPEEVEGLVGYMVRIGLYHPGHMAMLLRTVLPYTLGAKQDELRDYLTEEEVRARLAALGMPWHSIYHLEHHDQKLIEGKALREALENMPPE